MAMGGWSKGLLPGPSGSLLLPQANPHALPPQQALATTQPTTGPGAGSGLGLGPGHHKSHPAWDKVSKQSFLLAGLHPQPRPL